MSGYIKEAKGYIQLNFPTVLEKWNWEIQVKFLRKFRKIFTDNVAGNI
ncbi:MAG: hypothetical protein UV73_C0017G0002 [Candidatus Gottesmanbacteria bacterium GW2011_GWA2_43_14]|uniref:Uncharacterized protein n=1 Tax=Candidatus Gottesmanbacteria bacterium GW2011_GWA2_43_14 TaxID=1618443 RepID=A0A0G1G951_9BACT|nr:MAG: hypothetical protein UV73_C0017G0002 [Candidatus Gottesmanbacteria bacterium GW2011_GWA2_43_14]